MYIGGMSVCTVEASESCDFRPRLERASASGTYRREADDLSSTDGFN